MHDQAQDPLPAHFRGLSPNLADALKAELAGWTRPGYTLHVLAAVRIMAAQGDHVFDKKNKGDQAVYAEVDEARRSPYVQHALNVAIEEELCQFRQASEGAGRAVPSQGLIGAWNSRLSDTASREDIAAACKNLAKDNAEAFASDNAGDRACLSLARAYIVGLPEADVVLLRDGRELDAR